MENLFDLNIEQVLEAWEPEHAVREIIANALDEQILTDSRPIEVFSEGGKWHVRDYGRGLQYIHFTQNENEEKLNSPLMIGKFGVGLKDALAVFYRKGIRVEISSKYAYITLVMSQKEGFDVETLHAAFHEPKDRTMQGTDVALSGISESAIHKAKSMFLHFNTRAQLLEQTKYGDVYRSNQPESVIYINGVQVATEENFLFSYNITNINAQIKKALNRERSNVGRTAYSNTVKNILRQCKSYEVLHALVDDLRNSMSGLSKDESKWSDIAAYAAQTLNRTDQNVVFMTPTQRNQLSNQQVEILQESGKNLVMVTEDVYDKVSHSVVTFHNVHDDYAKSFRYDFVGYNELAPDEQKVFDCKETVLRFLRKHGYRCDAPVKISKTIRMDAFGNITEGVWDSQEGAIIIKKAVLSSEDHFLGVLAHEFAHYNSGYEDNTRDFESVLTKMLGHALFDIHAK